MDMKKIVLVLAVMLPFALYCQSTDIYRLSIGAVMPEYENIPAEALQNLESKMQSLVVSQGVGDNISAERFLITAKVDVIIKDITRTSPPKVSMKMDVTFIIGDLVEDKIYGTHTMSVEGIGVNENKAYIAAFQCIKPNNPALLEFVSRTKQSILEYYNNNCPFIISEAERKASMGQYDEAITQLITVPSVCSDCYALCQTKSLEIYEQRRINEQEKLNHSGRELIRQARSAWNVKRDYECAQRALDLLAQVDPDASCVNEADELVNEISTQLRKTEQQQLAFKMRQYADRRQAQADKTTLFGALIDRLGRFDINIKKEKTKRWGLAK